MSTITLLLSITIFNKVKGFRYLERALNLKYLPIGEMKKQFTEDLMGFINMNLIWVFLLFEFSITYNFAPSDILLCTILLFCYYMISIGFSLPERKENDTEKDQKEISKKSFKITFFFVLSQVLISFVVTPLLKINMMLLFVIIPILAIWPYFRVYKKVSNFEDKQNLKIFTNKKALVSKSNLPHILSKK